MNLPTAGEAGFVTAFAIGPTGDVTEIYPNAFHPDNFARAGATIEIPGFGARALVSGPVGPERIEIVHIASATAPQAIYSRVSITLFAGVDARIVEPPDHHRHRITHQRVPEAG